MSLFDPQAFLDAAYTESNDTKLIPVPVGEYTALIEKVSPRTWQSKDGTQSGVALDIEWVIEDQEVKALLGRETIKCRQGLMLDLTDDGKLDMSKGKNIGLGKLREALNLNQEGQVFSFGNLPGRMALVQVTHRDNEKEPGEVFTDIRKVSAL